ncbi:MAG TPA: TolC family protein [Spirochaetia bacterium]|nr:TolC family protein [Spirochaetia bacterium]
MQMHFEVKKAILVAAALLVLGAGYATAQQAPSATQQPPVGETVTLDQIVAAARAVAPGLKLASITVDTARAQLIQTQATNGLSLAGKGDYFHQGSLGSVSPITTPSAAAATASGGGGLGGENVQGGLTLSSPSTSVGLTAQHSIMEITPSDQVSSVSLSASQTVFDGYPGGRASAVVQQADYTYRSAQVAYDATLKSVLYQVKQAYYTLLVDQKTVLIRQATVTQDEQNLAYYQGLRTAGRATDLDVLQNQVTLTQAQLDLATAQNTVESDRKNLSQQVGWPLDKQYAVADSAIPVPPSITPEDALKTAFQNRSELLTFDLNIAAANINLVLQKSQSYPVVSVNGTLGVGQDWTANVNAGSFTVGASIALPILDGGLRGAQTQQAADQVSSLKVQQDQERQAITIAVENALFSVQDTRNRLDLAGQNVKAAQGQYDLQKARYAVGLVTTLDVLTAFQALTTAQVGLEQAKSNYILALLNLDNVMGL